MNIIDKLFDKVYETLGWTIIDKGETCVSYYVALDRYGNEVDCYNVETIMIEPIEYNELHYNQINVFGGDCIEFQPIEDNCESECWSNFDDWFIEKVLEQL